MDKCFNDFVIPYFQNRWNIYLLKKSLKLVFRKYQYSNRPIGQSLAKFGRIHTKWRFRRKKKYLWANLREFPDYPQSRNISFQLCFCLITISDIRSYTLIALYVLFKYMFICLCQWADMKKVASMQAILADIFWENCGHFWINCIILAVHSN